LRFFVVVFGGVFCVFVFFLVGWFV
jgi:hypothetical protein